MPNIIENIFLITDVDGTLLDDNHKLSQKNKNAIQEFIKLGGTFTIATGRGIGMALPIINELELKIPSVIFNGAAIYDPILKKIVWNCDLPDDSIEYLKLINNEFPTASFEILKNDSIYVPVMNELEEKHLALGGILPKLCGFDEIPKGNWIKALIIDETYNIKKIHDYIEKSNFDKVHWVRSSPIYYEMLPRGINKGTGTKKLVEMLNFTDKYLVTAGDYMNDIEMIEMANLGVAVENAQDSVKTAAKLIVNNNNNNSIYEIIEYLKRMG